MVMKDSYRNRRTFLKNSALSVLGIGVASELKGIHNPSSNNKLNTTCPPTTKDYYGEGPFYTENPPMIEMNKLASDAEPGTRIWISGRVHNLDCTEFIPNTVIDVWHADAEGNYDNSGYHLRGYTLTNDQGFYLFETILPGKYLNGNQHRPSHIHFKIFPPNYPQLTTQLYFEGDTSIPTDAAASITSGTFDASSRIIPLFENSVGALEGVWDIVVEGEGTVGTQDIHLNNGMIYKVSPNPFSDEVEIVYGVFKKAQVGLIVYDIQGRQVAELENREMTPQKYTATWRPNSNLSSGHYFVAIRINDLQVHYLKMIKQ